MLRYFTHRARRLGNISRGTFRASWLHLMGALAIMASLSGIPSTDASVAAAPTDAIVGTWTGVLDIKQTQLHLIFTVTRLDSGELAAEINSVDQGAMFPIDALTVEDRSIRFEIHAVGGVYQGKLNDDGTEMSGTWKQATAEDQSLSFKRSTESVAAAPAKVPGPTERPFSIPLDVWVPVPPTAFSSGGKTHLAYELHVTNLSPWDCVISGLDIVAGDSGSRVLASFTQADLQRVIERRATEKSRIAPEASIVIYAWATVDRPEEAPTKLQNRLRVKIGDYAEVLTLQTQAIPVATNTLVVSPPLKGDRWVAGGGPSNTAGHRRALIPVEGRAVIAQRFAIDWIQVGKNGKTFRGDPLDNKSYYAYGAEAFAVADGVVAATLDGVPSNIPGPESRAVPITLENIGGNHIVLDIGNGYYAFYAHLQPGSLRFKVGDKVRRGEVVGLVGNTGNSTEPHLHFHIANAPGQLGAEGLPYALTSFEVRGRLGDASAANGKKSETRKISLPYDAEIVRFEE